MIFSFYLAPPFKGGAKKDMLQNNMPLLLQPFNSLIRTPFTLKNKRVDEVNTSIQSFNKVSLY